MKDSPYMTWAKRHAAARYNLANSGILPCDPEDLPLEGLTLPLNTSIPEGHPPLKAAIAAHTGADPDGVVLAAGTSGANFLACAALIERGDEVLVEQPTYDPLLSAVRYLGAEVRRFSRSFENGHQVDLEEFRRLLSPRTRLIVLTSPHNPSGVVVPPAVLSGIGELAAEAGAHVLVDEVYREILFEEAPPPAVRLGPRFVATASLTKCYGLGGLRCGWILADPPIAERMRRLNDLMAASGPVPAEALGELAFRHLARLSARSRALIEPSTRLVHAFLREQADRLECVVPPRSMTVFPRLRHGSASDALHDRLRRRETSIVPGRFFEAPRHFRIGFGVRTEEVAAGLERLAATLADPALSLDPPPASR